jgi:hypothetical protein
MQLRKAVVRNGRLTLDEPTDLPEGTVVELAELQVSSELRHQAESGGDLLVQEVDLDAPSNNRVVNLADEMEPDELDRFRKRLRVSLAQAEAGKLIPADEVLAKLHAK